MLKYVLEKVWQDGYIQTNGIQLHYVTKGQGKLMLMLHGFPEFWYSWRYQITEFSQDYKVVALDLRGYNESDKPQALKAYQITELVKDIEGVIRGLGYDNCILVAHDWGGAIAWYFANTYPEMIERLIIMNLPHPAKFKQGLKTPQQLLKSWYIFAFQLPQLPEWLLQRNNYQLIAYMFKAVDESAFSSEDLDIYREAAAKPRALTAMLNYYRNIFQGFFKTSQQEWKKLSMPILMIWGENDVALGKELTYGTEDYAENLTIKYIPNCSHWVQQEQPQFVNEYMRDFLNSDLAPTLKS
ncbi:alpha/beta hydrolase [Crocosphaera sp. XPORK-15E]|uniref:alpha/beta fold hydrolase n=1 Tax=Crocosphaera sp. XPORK-15E TaxID=3110247 RepID=UPI002B20AF90|nr:alpha/beta hydrolase [Crocosphaera sp. XPORK-15E]MEA5535554.1 alpha/beta hydrolase [Crocosphaera sp. XPORK-15E]